MTSSFRNVGRSGWIAIEFLLMSVEILFESFQFLCVLFDPALLGRDVLTLFVEVLCVRLQVGSSLVMQIL